MFCPACGLEDKQSNQFCRACGSDLRVVRGALARPDAVTDSAISAREEIGRAVAAKIREVESAYELKKVAEDVLPQIEKFLESPAEKRLRRVRTGTIVCLIGFGATVGFTLAAMFSDPELFFFACLGFVTLCIGMSFVLNGVLFSIPKKHLSDNSNDATNQRELDAQTTGKLAAPDADGIISSVTENTTRHLEEKQPISRG